jgi:hypothetical protein
MTPGPSSFRAPVPTAGLSDQLVICCLGVPLHQWQATGVYGSGSNLASSPPMSTSASGSAQPHMFSAGSPHPTMRSYLNPSATAVVLPSRGPYIAQLPSHHPSTPFGPGNQSSSPSPMPNYSSSASTGAYTSAHSSAAPMFSSFPQNPQLPSHLAFQQPSGPHGQYASDHAIDPSLPDDVRDAMRAAYATTEWATGQNIPPEVIMPTVEKVGKEQFKCRICGKEHRRRDHCLTHVRTAHLGNKGFKCSQWCV